MAVETDATGKQVAKLQGLLAEKDARIESLASELIAFHRSRGWLSTRLGLYASMAERWFQQSRLRDVLNSLKKSQRLCKTAWGSITYREIPGKSYQGSRTISSPKREARAGGWRNVLVISGGNKRGATFRYRCSHTQEQLDIQGVPCEAHHVTSGAVPHLIRDHSVVILHRVCCFKHIEELVQTARAHEAKILFDIDDLVFDPELIGRIDSIGSLDAAQQALLTDTARRLRNTVEMCDGALVTTDHLVYQIARVGKAAWVHRNALSLEMIRLSDNARRKRKERNEGVIIGYASGSPNHNRDFLEVEEGLMEVLRHHEEAQFWIIGHLDVDRKWDALADRMRRIPFVPWRELPAMLSQLDINLAPLERDNPITEAKSEIKYVEAAAVGVPTIASRTSAFKYAIRHGDNGLLADRPEQWFGLLERLVEDKALRVEMGSRALTDVLQRYHPTTRGAELVATLNRIVPSLIAERHDQPSAIDRHPCVAS